jgi:hypothetical protein
MQGSVSCLSWCADGLDGLARLAEVLMQTTGAQQRLGHAHEECRRVQNALQRRDTLGCCYPPDVSACPSPRLGHPPHERPILITIAVIQVPYQ